MIAGGPPVKKPVASKLQMTNGWTTEAIWPPRYYRVTSGFFGFSGKSTVFNNLLLL